MLIVVYVFAFLLSISVLVVFHEFGHFWVARKLGVRVLRFSVGFGKPLYRYEGRDGVEYLIAAIPLGGYVQMLDENDLLVSLPERHAKSAFNRQPLWARAAIVAAGPAFNFILAFLLYVLMFMVGVSVMRPVVATVDPNSIAAEAGLLPNDEIIAVDQKAVVGWQQALLAIIGHSMSSDEVPLTVRRNGDERYALNLSLHNRNLLEDENVLGKLGITPSGRSFPALIAEVFPASAAARAGIFPGDRIVSLGDKPIDNWQTFSQTVAAQPGMLTVIGVERDGSSLSLPIEIDAKEDRQGKTFGHIGVRANRDRAFRDRNRILVQHGLWSSIRLAAARTAEMTSLTIGFIWQLISGQAPLKHIGGPIMIAEYTGISFLIGLGTFLGAIALLSISIGLINLLPIPALDGGHLLFHLIELFKGSPPSQLFQHFANRFGLVMLGGLMFLALFNDFTRLLQ